MTTAEIKIKDGDLITIKSNDKQEKYIVKLVNDYNIDLHPIKGGDVITIEHMKKVL